MTASEIQAAQLLEERRQPSHPDFSTSELQAARLLGTGFGTASADEDEEDGEELEEDEAETARQNRKRLEAAGRFLRGL